jgi:ABC-2 type transport system ATP-binding protein
MDGGRIHFDGSVPQLVASATGRVWLATERHPLAQHAWRTGSGLWRNVGRPPTGAELTDPTLEDAYLLLVGDHALELEMEAVS